MEAIILAGGFGKRLKGKNLDLPKPMVNINGRPFLDYVLMHLNKYNIDKIILSVYYQGKKIEGHYNSSFNNINISYSVDKIPLGSGGAVKAAITKTINNNIFVINGDTVFDIDLKILYDAHLEQDNDITLSLKPLRNFDRYGFAETDSDGKIIKFGEKKFQKFGLIDGGIYLIKNNIFDHYKGQENFLLSDYIRNNLNTLKIGSNCFDNLFIDIGTPEDLERAKIILKNYK